MTGNELLRRLRVTLQDAGEPYRHSTDQLWRWIQAAYMSIQRRSQQWDFLHQRGLFITTKLGDEIYSVGAIREISENSLYYKKPDSVAHHPIIVMPYATWSLEQQSGVRRDGPPLFLVENPDHTWRPYPAPDGVYSIYADWWLRPSEMENRESTPIWDEEYHEILLYEAMELAALLEPESAHSKLLFAESAKFLPPLRNAFNTEYLPQGTNPGPLL